MADKKKKTENKLNLGAEDFYLFPQQESEDDKWLTGEEGQLSVDVFEDDNNIYIESTIAGVKPDDIDIYINDDMVTIRGKREKEEKIEAANYHFRECYWGSFSRSVVLPTHVKPDETKATMKNGVLRLQLPKATTSVKVNVKEIEE